ncbi:MAG TPA: ATP-binding protein [Rhizomicrobium sp.]|jgi:signal transduction histidine kinase|nr:ATP-binding protein [Rhizomicrobium sp.]
MVAFPAAVDTQPSAGPSPSLSLLVMAALSVFSATLAGATVTWIQGVLLPVWLGSALVVYWFLCTPRRDWPTIAAVCWLAYVTASVVLGRGMPRSILLPTVNLIQALLVAAPLRALRLDSDFTRPRTLLVFYALVLGPVTMLAGLLAGFVLYRLTDAPVIQVWTEWYVTTALGLAMLVPILMVVRRESLAAIFARELLPGTLALFGIVAAAIALNILYHGYPLGFLFFPAVVLITFQRGFAGGALGLVVIVLYLASGLPDVHRTLSPADAGLHLIFVQLYTAAISFTVIIVGAGLAQRRKLELSLAEAREEAVVARDAAEAANRAKTMFLANMSHELRTPLNAVIGFSNLIHREMYGPLGDGRYREYARSIHDAGHHLLEVIGDILDMSKIEAGKYEILRETLSLNELVGECVELMSERAAERQVSLALDLAGPEYIVADRRAMKQIVLNLLSNAIKFTPAGGKVTAVTKTAGDRFVFAVVDTGVGIPAHELHRLGKPFIQLRRTTAAVSTQPGTGLGLALARAIAESHGGVLIIESEEGRGTCARVEIPTIATCEKNAA